jgi:hypothetical protein
VWQIGNKDNLDKLNTVQRKGLSIILGLPSTASLEAMEVMSGVIPLDFRREEIAIRNIGKIYSYSAKIPIKNQLNKWRRKENTDRHISPLGLMCLQGEEMKKETKIDVKNIEEEFQFHGLQTSKSPQEYWKNLGSSKTRTNEHEIKGRDLILQKITETTENTAVAFTDGSCLNNPGPCGAGAIVVVKEETSELKQPVCKRGSICMNHQ